MPAKPAEANWITRASAAAILGCGVRAVDRLIESGRLTHRDVPGSYRRVPRSEVEALAEACTVEAIA